MLCGDGDGTTSGSPGSEGGVGPLHALLTRSAGVRAPARLSPKVCMSLTKLPGVSWSWVVLMESEGKPVCSWEALGVWARLLPPSNSSFSGPRPPSLASQVESSPPLLCPLTRLHTQKGSNLFPEASPLGWAPGGGGISAESHCSVSWWPGRCPGRYVSVG